MTEQQMTEKLINLVISFQRSQQNALEICEWEYGKNSYSEGYYKGVFNSYTSVIEKINNIILDINNEV